MRGKLLSKEKTNISGIITQKLLVFGQILHQTRKIVEISLKRGTIIFFFENYDRPLFHPLIFSYFLPIVFGLGSVSLML